jgi:hypothetical protein
VNKLVKIFIPLLIILGLVLTGCAAKQASISTPVPIPAPSAPPAEGIFKSNPYEAQSGSSIDESGTSDIDRKIVRTGYITLEVNDVTEAMNSVITIAKTLDGYVVSSNKRGDQDITFGQISIRVPFDSFDEAFDRLRRIAVKVPTESTNSQDVTEQYTDLQAQLRNLEATEAQYLELLKKAEKVEDILAVQRELSNVRGQIEQVKGRILYLERTSDMALIDVNLQKTKPIGGTAWNALQTLKSAVRGLVTFGKVLANIAIWLAIFSPVWIIILVVVLYFSRWRKKKARASRS